MRRFFETLPSGSCCLMNVQVDAMIEQFATRRSSTLYYSLEEIPEATLSFAILERVEQRSDWSQNLKFCSLHDVALLSVMLEPQKGLLATQVKGAFEAIAYQSQRLQALLECLVGGGQLDIAQTVLGRFSQDSYPTAFALQLEGEENEAIKLLILKFILSKFPNVVSLSFSRMKFFDPALEGILECAQSLKTLEISVCPHFLGAVTYPQGLTRIDVMHAPFSAEGVQRLALQCQSLRAFSLFNCSNVRGSAFEQAALPSQLQELHLSEIDLTDTGAENVLSLNRSLQKLALTHCHGTTEKSIDSLASQNIEALDLLFHSISTERVNRLLYFSPKLQLLSLIGVANIDFMKVESHPLLRHLDVSRTQITCEEADHLVKLFPNLEILELVACDKVPQTKRDAIAQYLNNRKT